MVFNLFFLILLFFGVTILQANENEPMFGGMDRQNNVELYQQDQLFILNATNTFGTREHASIGYVDSGFEAHLQGKHKQAMQRFNEAWMLDENNPYSYVGFGVLYQHNEKYCKAMNMFDLAKEKDLDEPGFLADYALIISQCVNETNNDETKKELINKSLIIYAQAEKTTNEKIRAYVYQSWAKSSVILKRPEQALEKIKLIESLGLPVDNELKLQIETALNKS